MLNSAIVEPGQVFRRVCRTRRFIAQLVAVAVSCSGVHVLVGWLVFTNFGKLPFATAGDACYVMPGHQDERGVSLISEGKRGTATNIFALFMFVNKS